MVHLTILHLPKSRMACHQGAHCPASNHLANPAIKTMKCKISTSILFKIRWDYHPHSDHWLKITCPKRGLVFQPSKPHLDCSKSRRNVSSLKNGVYFCQVFVGFQWVPSFPQHDMITFALFAASKWSFFHAAGCSQLPCLQEFAGYERCATTSYSSYDSWSAQQTNWWW